MTCESAEAVPGPNNRLWDNTTEHILQLDLRVATFIHRTVVRINLACSKAKVYIDKGFKAKKLNVFQPIVGEFHTKE